MMIWVSRKRGVQLVEGVVGQFEKLIADLDRGVWEINAEQDQNDAAVTNARLALAQLEQEMEEKNATLEAGRTKALAVQANLKKLLSA